MAWLLRFNAATSVVRSATCLATIRLTAWPRLCLPRLLLQLLMGRLAPLCCRWGRSCSGPATAQHTQHQYMIGGKLSVHVTNALTRMHVNPCMAAWHLIMKLPCS